MQGPQPGRPSEQRADIAGRNNFIVQIVGDGNTVVAGYPHLTLTRYLTRRAIETEVDLLSPYTRSIALVDRDHELDDLREWLTRAKPIAIRVMTGGAGTGKTRLALELCESVLDKVWDAGFVEGRELERFCAQQNLSTWGWQRPTLAVIDNAAAFAEALHGWHQELADNPGDPAKPLRLLLLERHADSGGGWWPTAFGRGGPEARAVQRLLDPNAPVELASLVEPSMRREILHRTIEASGSAVHLPEPEEDPAFDRHLAELSWSGEPLFLMMAGLSAVRSTLGNVLSLSRTDLAFERADEELARIERVARRQDLSPEVLIHLAAYATLCRGLPRDAVMTAANEEKAALGRPEAGDAARFADALHMALPGP